VARRKVNAFIRKLRRNRRALSLFIMIKFQCKTVHARGGTAWDKKFCDSIELKNDSIRYTSAWCASTSTLTVQNRRKGFYTQYRASTWSTPRENRFAISLVRELLEDCDRSLWSARLKADQLREKGPQKELASLGPTIETRFGYPNFMQFRVYLAIYIRKNQRHTRWLDSLIRHGWLDGV